MVAPTGPWRWGLTRSGHSRHAVRGRPDDRPRVALCGRILDTMGPNFARWDYDDPTACQDCREVRDDLVGVDVRRGRARRRARVRLRRQLRRRRDRRSERR